MEASSFQLINSSDGEVTVRGIDKAYGMEQYLRYAGIRREDSAAFGDGPNDLGMLEYAGTGVAMGNAGAELKSRRIWLLLPLARTVFCERLKL